MSVIPSISSIMSSPKGTPIDGYGNPITHRTPIVDADGVFYLFDKDGRIVRTFTDGMEAMTTCLVLYEGELKLNVPYEYLEKLCDPKLGVILPSPPSNCAPANTGLKKSGERKRKL